MATNKQAAPKLKIVPKASAAVVAAAASERAANGLPFDPLPRKDVLQLIKAGAMEAVDRELKGKKDYMLLAVRFLLEHSYPAVWDMAEKGRGIRVRAEQNAIFKLNYWADVVSRYLLGEKVDFNHYDWDPRAWKTKQRNQAEWAEVIAALPAEHRKDNNQILWALDEKKMRDKFAKDDRAWVKLRAQRALDLPKKELKTLDGYHAGKVREREAQLQRQKRQRLAPL
jgi:hypothetical protein